MRSQRCPACERLIEQLRDVPGVTVERVQLLVDDYEGVLGGEREVAGLDAVRDYLARFGAAPFDGDPPVAGRGGPSVGRFQHVRLIARAAPGKHHKTVSGHRDRLASQHRQGTPASRARLLAAREFLRDLVLPRIEVLLEGRQHSGSRLLALRLR